jgi:NADH-quinone oxidoreductase subunit L
MRNMGGLRRYLPTTYWTYLLATLAISGAPLTAGFFSKDLILWHAFSSPHGSAELWLVGWLTAGMTAFYMFRQFFMVFHGEFRGSEHAKAHIHESPPAMTLVLVVLAAGSIFAGWLGTPDYLWGNRWDPWLEPIFGGAHEAGHGAAAEEMRLMALTLAIGGLGFVLAYIAYGRKSKLPDQIASLAGGAFYRALFNNYYIDQLYDVLIVRPFTYFSRWCAQFFDPAIIDGLVNAVAKGIRGLSLIWREVQTGNVQHYVAGFLAATVALLLYFLGQQ